MLADPEVAAELDETFIHEYPIWRYVLGPNTFFKGVWKLRPGSFLIWRRGRTEERRYWRPPEESQSHAAEPHDPIAGFLNAVDDAVRIRLRSDVPIGAFLSEGCSSAVVATLVHLGASGIRTFSVGFRGDPISELPAAAETARLFGAKHTPIEFEPDDLVQALPLLSRHRGGPVAETAHIPMYLMSVEASKSVKVVLSGEGSDEIFGGYPKHHVEAFLGRFAGSGLMAAGGRGLLAAAALVPSQARRFRIAGRAMSERRFEERMVRWFGALTPAERDRLWCRPAVSRASPTTPFRAAPDASALRRVLHFDQTSWLLERMDMMTTAASVEARTPFMDVRLTEFAASLTDHWTVKGRVGKRIVREALATSFHDAFFRRPKNGFRMPVTEWFRGPLKEPFGDLLRGSGAVSRDYLDARIVANVARKHADGSRDHDKALWALLSFEVFLREFF